MFIILDIFFRGEYLLESKLYIQNLKFDIFKKRSFYFFYRRDSEYIRVGRVLVWGLGDRRVGVVVRISFNFSLFLCEQVLIYGIDCYEVFMSF